MNIGKMRHRVTIQNFTTTRDAGGQPIETWNDIATVWAEVSPISGRELVSSGAVSAEATIRVWMRFRRDVSAASRLYCLNGPFKGLALDIIGPPIPDGKCTRLEILCKLGVKRD
ncbi:phage head closure protein [Pectobacterium wasabiae]|uniref:Head-tail adaptor protein n=1 Tax=Pectobacterium wasabiae TaxID=55208 RepID=A0AAW3EM06_9GAMM|nr:phage head closure protein [Pectobacterium wasabiae]AOR64860.1 head-tail adaptor protein [Pectobacterium wasabiae CFBP 3304]EJS96283.1 Putative head-tail adaptor [Pectobacterium wasabiae CFBP 3304]KFX09873.1 head-tail adaptor protein [Pectobacterium wasabiae]KGA30075.1 head-tail adaptor protein [Pectobacterium wasabiae]